MAEHDLISKTALLKHLDMAIECKDCPRNANKELYKCVHNLTSERCTCSDIAQICIRITEFATFSDVQPVKHGRWELTDNPSFKKCSECGAWWSSDVTDNYFTNYCPKCGAKMRGAKNG